MKLQIMSDLHFEMHADGGAELIREVDPTGVDVLVLAGDITMARRSMPGRSRGFRWRSRSGRPAKLPRAELRLPTGSAGPRPRDRAASLGRRC
jgi:hypothetical protein